MTYTAKLSGKTPHRIALVTRGSDRKQATLEERRTRIARTLWQQGTEPELTEWVWQADEERVSDIDVLASVYAAEKAEEARLSSLKDAGRWK